LYGVRITRPLSKKGFNRFGDYTVEVDHADYETAVVLVVQSDQPAGDRLL
jgi:hypothetical protein